MTRHRGIRNVSRIEDNTINVFNREKIENIFDKTHPKSLINCAEQMDAAQAPLDSADAVLDIIHTSPHEDGKYGIHHYSHESVSSLYDFAKASVDIEKIPIAINPVISNYYANPTNGPEKKV